MNKRKIPFYFAFALALSYVNTPVLAQYIPLTDLPEVPTQMNESGQIIQPYSQSGVNAVSDQLSLDVIDSVDLDTFNRAQHDAPYGQVAATSITATSVDEAVSVPDGSTTTPEPIVTGTAETERDGGWQGLANVLKKLEPSVDTSLPESRSQLSQRINGLINSGRHQAALSEIAKVFSSTGYIESPGEDVQLRFLQARAFAGLGQHQQALESYKDLNSKYPELPEPYNNLAAMQMSLGLLDEAYESLNMAIALRPNYGIAQRNLGMVHLLKAEKSFDIAAKQRVGGAAQAAQSVRQILQRGSK
ncbi:MAG: tetratricopeptide repeat protein [Alcaligenaceae bacterium]|nr:tetratricopeptide repeat protein [Alcaligenaceae bacterium]